MVAADRVQRKLSAILAADVAGYSKLMAKDELGTHARLGGVLESILKPSVKRHGGRIFKVMGDGAMVAFSSAHAAVQCAVDIQ